MAAITCILAPFSVPGPGAVPISLATFAVMLSAALLGGKLSTLSVVLYLLIGAIGLPVFSAFRGGAAVLAGPTGGYLIGYLLLALVGGFLYYRFGRERKGVSKTVVLILSMIAGTIPLYALGTVWFIIVTKTDLAAALMLCVVPFLVGDALKIAAVCILTPILEGALGKAFRAESPAPDAASR